MAKNDGQRRFPRRKGRPRLRKLTPEQRTQPFLNKHLPHGPAAAKYNLREELAVQDASTKSYTHHAIADITSTRLRKDNPLSRQVNVSHPIWLFS